MLGAGVDDGDLRAIQPVNQSIDKRRARSARADDDDTRLGGQFRRTGRATKTGSSKAGSADPQKAAP